MDKNRLENSFFSSGFLLKLVDGEGYQYDNVKRWTRKDKPVKNDEYWSQRFKDTTVFEFDKLFFPINITNTHWTLAVIYVTEKRIQYYDSIAGYGGPALEDKYLNALFQWLQDEHKDKCGTELPDKESWKKDRCNKKSTPQQKNGVDCGVFTIMFADYLSDNLKLSFTQKDIPKFRLKIGHHILNGKLDDYTVASII